MRTKKDKNDKIRNRYNRRLVFQSTLIVGSVFFVGIVFTLIVLVYLNNFVLSGSFESIENIEDSITDNLYAILIILLSIVLLHLFINLIIYELTFKKAEAEEQEEQEILIALGENANDELEPIDTTIHHSTLSLDSESEESVSRFPTLYSMDIKYPVQRKVKTPASLSLKGICNKFREYASGTLKRYYQIKDVRSFVSSMACSKIILLQGMSGTGKTSLPVAFGQFICFNTPVIPVQPTWKERSDLLGYYNEFTGKFSETPLLNSLYEAGTTDSIELIVLDEANIARIEYYFAEFLSLLELPNPKSRKLQVASSYMEYDPKRIEDGNLLLPENVWFICTANNDDSTFAISDKVYDRAAVIDLDSRAEPFASEKGSRVEISYSRLLKLFSDAQRRYQLTTRDVRKIKELDLYLKKVFRISFGNRIMKQIESFVPVYVACGGKSSEAIDIMLAKKVMRKLSSCNPVYVKSRSDDLISEMNKLFGQDNTKECVDAIRRIADNG